MNIRFFYASEATNQNNQDFATSRANLKCVEIPNPTVATNKFAAALDKQFGYFSEAKKTIRRYVMPVVLNGNVNAIFYHHSMRHLVEVKVAEFVAKETVCEKNRNHLAMS